MRLPLRLLLLASVVAHGPSLGCNLVTGADDLHVRLPDDGDGDPSGAGGSGSTGPGSGATGAGLEGAG
ncbi:MAG: hypothetical protein JRI23_34725, partial [Deltaproteobacteria bacterium]|nr:hypothetical protein [Deltaproteobacteria bacterium]MBW2537455.1 hypothetical protein [Deltaproteobacteria bacterium]